MHRGLILSATGDEAVHDHEPRTEDGGNFNLAIDAAVEHGLFLGILKRVSPKKRHPIGITEANVVFVAVHHSLREKG
jgi:hypothetical protein